MAYRCKQRTKSWEARKREQGIAGTAAKVKGKTGVSKPDIELIEFENTLKGISARQQAGELFDRNGGENDTNSPK